MTASSTKDGFCEAVAVAARAFALEVLAKVGNGELTDIDDWMRKAGGRFLRQMLGEALSQRAESLAIRERCGVEHKGVVCEGKREFRQHRPYMFRTVLPGRDVLARAPYAQCVVCGSGDVPLRRALGADKNGFTHSLRALAVKAATMEPYETASSELLGEFAAVEMSADKIQQVVREVSDHALEYVELGMPGAARPSGSTTTHLYAQIDGSMLHVDKRWQETKLAVLFEADARVPLSEKRATLLRRVVTAVRGDPQALEARLQPTVDLFLARQRPVICIADGAEWIWRLVERLFPDRVEILDWYHLKEHISAAAQILFGPDNPEGASWLDTQLDRLLEHDDVDSVLSGLVFLSSRYSSGPQHDAIEDLTRYLSTHRARITYKTFRQRGYFIGSGAVESANSHTLQQRMKRTGMRWHQHGADALIALRSIYRSTDAWPSFITFALRRAA